MASEFYTVMIVPSHASKARQLHIPAWAVRAGLVMLPIALLIGVTLLLDYRFVANQVFENRELQAENRRLRQSVQLYQNRMSTLESSLERIENFSARLKMITNLMDRDQLSKQLELPLPNASSVSALNPELGDSEGAMTKTEKPMTKEELALRDSVDQRFESLNHQSLSLEQNLHDLYELLSDQRSFLNALPTKKPADGYFTSGFGIRVSPLGDGVEKMHEGLDIANVVGTQIQAPAQGSVVFAGRKSGYGQIVILDHGYGLETWYGHTSRVLVKAGQLVNRGQTIALIGNSGRSTGSHLHYEVRVQGIPVDPLNYILEN
jgi:murein DD-endopeptidase MepM/ murein hydrolase activator NlpD